MELTLIRSGWLPDHTSDIGMHEFTYAILPHSGDWREGNVVAAGQAINQKPVVVAATGEEAIHSGIVQVEGGVLSNIKRAESGDGMVLRIYQPGSERTELVIRLNCGASGAEEQDLLEHTVSGLEIQDGCIRLPLEPYEIKTIKILD